MSDDPPLNWVQRRKRAEEHLESGLDDVWRDVRAALEDTSRSLKELYGFDSETEKVNGHRFRLKILKTPTQSKIREVNLDFDKFKQIVTVEYMGAARPAHRYTLSADSNSTFILDSQENAITPDEISRQILEPIFFGQPIKYRTGFLG
jgi:hypothetical protein